MPQRFGLPIALLLLVACASAPAIPPTAPAPTPLAIIQTPTGTAPAPATRTPEPGFTLLPATPAPPTETAEPCVNDAQFIRDVTVPDFSEIAAGAAIDKRWAVRNSGTCDWSAGYRIVFVDGHSMSAAAEHALYPARAGQEADVQIKMIAPDAPGEYSGRWQLRSSDGAAFGPVLFIKIRVAGQPTAAP